MKKFLILAAALLVSAAGAQAQLLWKVSGNSSKGDSYLFGTHHIAPVSIMDSIAGFGDAMKGVEAIVGEIDMIATDQSAMQQMVLQKGMAPTDSLLTMVLTPAQTDSVNTVLAKYTGGQLNVQALAVLKPAMVTTQLAMLQNMTAFPGFNPTEQLDTEIQKRAKALGCKIEAFETVDEQLDLLLGKTPISLQARALMEVIAEDDKAIEQAQKLASAYTGGDFEAIGKMIFDESEGNETMARRLITDRNNNWIEKLQQILPQQTVMVAVGVGHLVGDEGLVAGLRKLGYTVTPVVE